MKPPKRTVTPDKFVSEIQLARLRLAKTESQLVSAKEQARLAKRRRKEAKLAARRAKKQARQAKREFVQAKLALAEAEEKLARAEWQAARISPLKPGINTTPGRGRNKPAWARVAQSVSSIANKATPPVTKLRSKPTRAKGTTPKPKATKGKQKFGVYG